MQHPQIIDLEIIRERNSIPACVKGREYFKPFAYPEMFELAMKHEQMHWLPTEASLNEDVIDWKQNLTEEEKNLLTQLFRFLPKLMLVYYKATLENSYPCSGKHQS